MFFDSHAHLDDARFDGEREQIISSLSASGIDYVCNIGADLKSSEASVALAESYDFIYAAVGVHPNDAETFDSDALERIKALSKYKKVVAIGEIGLDYHYPEISKSAQRTAFEAQLAYANSANIPVIIHNRDAHNDCLSVIKNNPPAKGVYHCYSGSLESAYMLISMGFMLSFTGVLTFKNAKTAVEVVRNIPFDRIMIETDCPYLCPEPHRGERNNPAMVRYVAEKIAEIKGVSLRETARITTENAKRFFGI